MTILFPYSTRPADQARQQPARAALAKVAARHPEWTIQAVPCVGDQDYETAIRAVWGTPFVVWEHDLAPTPEQVETLIACPELFCAWKYRIWKAPDELARFRQVWDALQSWPGDARRAYLGTPGGRWLTDLYLNHSGSELVHRVRLAHGHERWATPEDVWADAVGLGLTKFAGAVPPPSWTPGTWRDLDSRIMDTLTIRWHLHGPDIPHHHGCACHI